MTKSNQIFNLCIVTVILTTVVYSQTENLRTVKINNVETIKNMFASELASHGTSNKEVTANKKKLLDESDYKWAYESAFEDESCGSDIILGSATPLNKCFTTYTGNNIDKPSGSRLYVCDGNTFTSRVYPDSQSCEDNYEEFYMPVGCTQGGWTRRASAKYPEATDSQMRELNMPRLLSDDPNNDPPLDDQAYGDDFWGTHPIGNSYSVSCATEEEFQLPDLGGNLVFEHVFDSSDCSDSYLLSAINYFRQYYCFQMSPESSGEFFFPILSMFSDTACTNYYATEELPLECAYTPYGDAYQGSDVSDNLSSYWAQHFAPTPAPVVPTRAPSNRPKANYHHAKATTSPGMVALYFFISLISGFVAGAGLALLYYVTISRNSATHRASLHAYFCGAHKKVSTSDGFNEVEMETNNPMSDKEGW